MTTGIEWTDETWNPIVGCSVTSPGCANCYAMRQAHRLLDGNPKTPHYAGTTKLVNGNAVWTGKVAMAPERVLLEPYRAKWPKRYSVNSMGDLFHPNVPDEWIDRVYGVMVLSPTMTFQVLTKQPARMREYWRDVNARWRQIAPHVKDIQRFNAPDAAGFTAPLPNVWLGVSVESQAAADERIPLLLKTPAARRFISAEPLLGTVSLREYLTGHETNGVDLLREIGSKIGACTGWVPPLDWVIVGGESGKGARPMHSDWVRAIRDDCAAVGVPFFFKQWGSHSLHEINSDGAVMPPIPATRSFLHLKRFDHGAFREAGKGETVASFFREGVIAAPVRKGDAGCLLDGVEHKAMG